MSRAYSSAIWEALKPSSRSSARAWSASVLRRPATSAGVDLAQEREARGGVVVLHVGLQQPDRRIDAGIERHDHARHAEVARHAAGMQRARAAEGEQLEVAQVVAAHGGDRLDRLLHLHVDDAHDAFGRGGHVHAERPGDLVLDRLARACAVSSRMRAAEEIVLAEIAEHEIAVGDGRLSAAAAVAGRARHRAGRIRGRPRAGPRRSTRAMVPPPALTVLMSIIGTAMIAALDLAAIRRRRLTVLDQRHVAAGAAHVEGDEIAAPGRRARGRPPP